MASIDVAVTATLMIKHNVAYQSNDGDKNYLYGATVQYSSTILEYYTVNGG